MLKINLKQELKDNTLLITKNKILKLNENIIWNKELK